MKISRIKYFVFVALSAIFFSCGEKENPIVNPVNGSEDPTPASPTVTKPSLEIQQADQFAIDLFSTFYLWSAEVKKDLPRLTPDTCKVPVSVVKEIRYHKDGKTIDRWTELTPDLESMTSSVQGLGLSYGYGIDAFWADESQTNIVFIVQYVNNGKPAQLKGLKRGDVIWKVDGSYITSSNYSSCVQKAYYSNSVTLDIGDDPSHIQSISMTADTNWENPIIVSKTFDIDGKKVGYLFYSAFDIDSATYLPDVFRKFKQDGIEELILDLRYNGGGFAFTECELASMIAPPANVAAGDVFQTEIYNAILSEAWKDEDFNTYFHTKFDYKDEKREIHEDVADANPGIKKLYAIVTQGSASASEGLIVGLAPYIDIELIGDKHTYGKYCAGYMMSPENLYGKNSSYDYSEITNWGMYVMVSMFTDKDGKNAAQPSGIPVDIQVEEKLWDGYQLGDENETMLKAALIAAGKSYPETRSPGTELLMESVSGRYVLSAKPKGFLIKTDVPSFRNNF